MHLTRLRSHLSVTLIFGAALILGACGDPSDGTAATPAPPVTEAAASTSEPAPSTTAQVAFVDVYSAVQAYPACGNEPFTHLGITWYPVSPVDSQPIDDALLPRLTALLAVDREQPLAPSLAGFARVSPPGPGDDTGTLVVWADGVARWTSDSGNLDVWLVDEPITYNWVC